MREAEAIDPASATIASTEMTLLLAARRFDEAREVIRRTTVLEANFAQRFKNPVIVFVYTHQLDSALAIAKALDSVQVETPMRLGRQLFVYAVTGRWTEFDRVASQVDRGEQITISADRLMLAIVRGDHATAMKELETSLRFDGALGNTLFVGGCEPWLDPLKDKPEFPALMSRLGIRTCPERTPWPIKPRPVGAR